MTRLSVCLLTISCFIHSYRVASQQHLPTICRVHRPGHHLIISGAAQEENVSPS